MSTASEVSLAVVPVRAAAEMARLPPPVRRLLKLCDGTRTRTALCSTGILPAEHAERALERLLALGVVEEVLPRRRSLTPRAVAWVSGAAAEAVEPIAPVAEPIAPVAVAVEPIAPVAVAVEPIAPVAAAVEPIAAGVAAAAAPIAELAAQSEAPSQVPSQMREERNPAVTDPVAVAVLAAQATLPDLRFSDDEESFFASNLEHLAEYE